MADIWLLVKRGLYYRPGGAGYTGIRDQAGTYTLDEAKRHAEMGDGVSMVRLDQAHEFSAACFEDIARAYLQQQRDAALDEIERLRRDCAELYQVIGTMREHCPDREDPAIIKALDNASDAAVGDPRRHDDLLPFVLPEPASLNSHKREGSE